MILFSVDQRTRHSARCFVTKTIIQLDVLLFGLAGLYSSHTVESSAKVLCDHAHVFDEREKI